MRNTKCLCVLVLFAISFVSGCKDEQNKQPYGTPPTISDIKLFLFKGLDANYAEETEVTEWKEGDVILGFLTITDPDMDVTNVSYTCKCINNGTAKSGRTQFKSQENNHYFEGFIIDDLTAGSWLLTVEAKDNGSNSSTYNFNKVLVVKQY